ncbi:MAG TPA: glycosyltransferase family 25 protein, partial [Chlamydiales bacterium]|nr:glycosyltransferase family 25 protein [Chlamydiales bacterium]
IVTDHSIDFSAKIQLQLAALSTIDHQSIAKEYLASKTASELDHDWKLNEFFGSVYVIHLPDAHERRQHIQSALHSIGVKNWQIFPATNGRTELKESIWRKMHLNWANIDITTPDGLLRLERQFQGEAGCFMSHFRLIESVRACYRGAVFDLWVALLSDNSPAIEVASQRAKKYSSVLVLEDDNGFGIVAADRLSATLENTGLYFFNAMNELPQDWQMLYLMSQINNPSKKVSSHLARLGGALTLNAYAVNNTMYDAIYYRLRKIIDPTITKLHPVDGQYKALHSKHRCYGVVPSIAYQDSNTSFITSHISRHLRQSQSYEQELDTKEQEAEFQN